MLERSLKEVVSEAAAIFIVWTFLVQGVFVFLVTVVCAFIIYGLHITPALELAAFTTLFSFVVSTPFYIILQQPRSDPNGFMGWYLAAGYIAGACVVLISTIGISLYRLWLWFTRLPQPLMPPPWMGALGIALIAVIAAIIAGLLGTRGEAT